MAANELEIRNVRDNLSQAIVEVVSSWPASHRRLFTAVHYAGSRIDEAGRASGIDPSEAAGVLELCERRLREALREFRRDDLPDKRGESSAPADMRPAV